MSALPTMYQNPMDLAAIRANMELGLYATADMCVSDIRLAFRWQLKLTCNWN